MRAAGSVDHITHYITRGPVRGQCDHKHRTFKGAQKCCVEDGKGCVQQGGYSDRRVYAVHFSEKVTGPYYE